MKEVMPFGLNPDTKKKIASAYKSVLKLRKKGNRSREKADTDMYQRVFHDDKNGVAVITEGHVLIASRSAYNPAYAGKCVDVDGNVYERGDYPKWTFALGNFYKSARHNNKNVHCALLPIDAIEKQRKAHGADAFESVLAGFANTIPVCMCDDFVQYFKLFGTDGWVTSQHLSLGGYEPKAWTPNDTTLNRALLKDTGDGVCLLMPMALEDFSYEEVMYTLRNVGIDDPAGLCGQVPSEQPVIPKFL